jgi:hypothetical protein
MKPDQFRGIFRRRPFRPFVVNTTSGNSYAVGHPEQMMISDSGMTLAVFQGEATIIIDVEEISDCVAAPSRPAQPTATDSDSDAP